MATNPKAILALDVGSKRIGVAVTSLEARLPRPLTTLDATDKDLFKGLGDIIKDEGVERIVVGLPRGMEGQHTAQTVAIMHFTELLKSHVDLPIDMQDESLTSQHAEAELQRRGKPYAKGDVDALAATYILEDWFTNQKELGVTSG